MDSETTILTDDRGVPFARPEAPAADADIETKIAYMRAKCAYNDAVTACGSRAFAHGLRGLK
jgi:hypothetical protein